MLGKKKRKSSLISRVSSITRNRGWRDGVLLTRNDGCLRGKDRLDPTAGSNTSSNKGPGVGSKPQLASFRQVTEPRDSQMMPEGVRRKVDGCVSLIGRIKLHSNCKGNKPNTQVPRWVRISAAGWLLAKFSTRGEGPDEGLPLYKEERRRRKLKW